MKTMMTEAMGRGSVDSTVRKAGLVGGREARDTRDDRASPCLTTHHSSLSAELLQQYGWQRILQDCGRDAGGGPVSG